MTKAIIFDFFGVICSEVSPRWFRSYFPEEKAKDLKDKYYQPVDLGKISHEELLQNLGNLVKKSPIEVDQELHTFVEINKETVSLITKLKEHYKIGLCSNANGVFLNSLLKKEDLAKLFDANVISSESNLVKPDHRIFELVLERLDVRAEEALFIDDNPSNIKGAAEIGLQGILFTSTQDLASKLSELDLKF